MGNFYWPFRQPFFFFFFSSSKKEENTVQVAKTCQTYRLLKNVLLFVPSSCRLFVISLPLYFHCRNSLCLEIYALARMLREKEVFNYKSFLFCNIICATKLCFIMNLHLYVNRYLFWSLQKCYLYKRKLASGLIIMQFTLVSYALVVVDTIIFVSLDIHWSLTYARAQRPEKKTHITERRA